MKYCPVERRERVLLAKECVYTHRVFFMVVRLSEWRPQIRNRPTETSRTFGILKTFPRLCVLESLFSHHQVWGSSAIVLGIDRSVTKPDYGLRRDKSKLVLHSPGRLGNRVTLYGLCSRVWTQDTMRRKYYSLAIFWAHICSCRIPNF